ncbi:hypothetical protein [Streptomyces sp. NPDC093568]|uniref:hypothetical protein n=1 Tax=Streptomyces sp. NPDC093568 TaxID=3366041 RepID=UPI003814F1FC
MAAGLFEGQYLWHPAADDRVLGSVCVDVRAGRWLSARDALAETRGDFGLRAHRSLVLASEAAGSDLVERWLVEDPGPEAALMWARVAVLRALRAADARDPRTDALERIALAACDRAATADPGDPTPWVAKLAMARLHRLRDQAPRGLLTAPAGPWRLFAHVLSLDPWHREAHHRFLACFFPRYGGSVTAAWDVAAFLGQRAPADSPVRLLPLVALVECYDRSQLLADRVWEQPQWRSTALSIHQDWLPAAAGYPFTPVLDLAYLAHALVMAGCEAQALTAFTAMGPYASRMPWSAFGDPAEQLSRARRACGLRVPAA